MPGFSKKEVYKITEMKNGCIYKTQKLKSIWLPLEPLTIQEESAIAKSHGGDMLVNTGECVFGKDPR